MRMESVKTLDSALVLSTFQAESKPKLISWSDGPKQMNFRVATYPPTEVEESCSGRALTFAFKLHCSISVTWQNRMIVFGGRSYKRQIAEVKDCGLDRIGDLPFDFNWGACTVGPEDQVFLCFSLTQTGFNQTKLCHSSKSPLEEFTKVPDSVMPHEFIKIASSEGQYHYSVTNSRRSLDYVFAAGSLYHPATELYSVHNETWRRVSDYPYRNDISTTPVLYFQDSFLVFGGYPNQGWECSRTFVEKNPKKVNLQFRNIEIIASFSLLPFDSSAAESWSEVGKLMGPRYGHAVIELYGQFMIIGGRSLKSSSMKTEVCSFTGMVLKILKSRLFRTTFMIYVNLL